MKKEKIPTILGIGFLILGIAAGVMLISNRQIFRLRASPEIAPKNVRVSNISEGSFSVSWTTNKETRGFIVWGESSESINKTRLDLSNTSSFIHYLLIDNLSPSKSYYFKINSDGRQFDSNGLPWQIKTGPQIPVQPGAYIISGSVTTSSGAPLKGALVFVTVGGGSLLSTYTSGDGSWAIPISTSRTQTLDSYLPINERTSLVEIFVQGGPLGVASAQIYPASAKPVPPIILGQAHNFKNLLPEKKGEAPEATISLPEESTSSSKFNVPEETLIPTTTVILENLDEGETLYETKPEFIGTGPLNSSISIKIESDLITGQVKTDSAGSWSFKPSTAISLGTHKITIQWKDSDGILRTLTRNFTVLAADATTTPTPTVIPTTTPTATTKLTPTPTLTLKASTESALQASGVLTPTLFLFIISLVSLTFGGLMLGLSITKRKEA